METERRARRDASRAVSDLLERGVVAALASPSAERLVVAALESPGAERLVDRVVNNQSSERLVAHVIESRLVDEAVARLLESEDLWILVDEVARSPAVTDAITQQSLGFADQVAGVVRGRSRSADERLERMARRLLRRAPDGAAPAPPVEP